MKHFGKLAVLGAVLAASTSFAFADTITGTIGQVNISTATDTGSTATSFILSSVGSTNVTVPGTPTLGNYSFNDAVYTFTASGGTITSSGPNAGSLAGEIFSGCSAATCTAANMVEFIGTSYTPIQFNASNGDYQFTILGFFEGAGSVGTTPGTDNFQFNAGTPVEVTENLAVSPEPNSLMLLGTGLLGAAGMFYRRRQTV